MLKRKWYTAEEQTGKMCGQKNSREKCLCFCFSNKGKSKLYRISCSQQDDTSDHSVRKTTHKSEEKEQRKNIWITSCNLPNASFILSANTSWAPVCYRTPGWAPGRDSWKHSRSIVLPTTAFNPHSSSQRNIAPFSRGGNGGLTVLLKETPQYMMEQGSDLYLLTPISGFCNNMKFHLLAGLWDL